jgi:hypothetical protein
MVVRFLFLACECRDGGLHPDFGGLWQSVFRGPTQRD